MKRPGAPTGTWPETTRIWLLGGFRVSVGLRTIEGGGWRFKKAAALVKLLALTSDHRIHLEQAIDVLWPELGKKAAASNNLRQVLYAARRVLDPAPNSHNRYQSLKVEQIALCPQGPLWVDIEAFEETAAAARRSRDPAAFRAALDLYAGDLLPEDRYEPWAEDNRKELRTLYIELLVELAERHQEPGEHGAAVDTLGRAVAEGPTNEEAHADLMRLYAHSGRPGEALAQYERLRGALFGQLGAPPSTRP